MKFIWYGPVLAITIVTVTAEDQTMTKLENKLLDMVVECKTCRSKQVVGKDRPAFSAVLKQQKLSLSNTIVKFDHVILNHGGGYDPTTGTFTAPRTGLYQISATVMSDGGNSLGVSLKQNDKILLNLYGAALHGTTETANPVIELTAGDKLYLFGTGHMYGDSFSYFSGFYISD